VAKWFVYSNATYYPDAVVVEADTPEAAVAVVFPDYPTRGGGDGVAVFPLDALAMWDKDESRGTIEEELRAWT